MRRHASHGRERPSRPRNAPGARCPECGTTWFRRAALLMSTAARCVRCGGDLDTDVRPQGGRSLHAG